MVQKIINWLCKYRSDKFEPLIELKTTLELLRGLKERMLKMAKELDDLTAEVAEEVTIMDSAVTLITGLAQRLRDAGTDPAKLKALQADLDTGGKALAQAVIDNTPAA